MPTRWSFFAFNWERYQALKPVLHPAWDSGDFSNLNHPDADEILAKFDEFSDPAEICNTLVLELCGEGEPLHVEAGLPALIHSLRRTRAGEDAAELLGTLIAAEPFVEEWWRVSDGLCGILTPEEVREASSGLSRMNRTWAAKPKPRVLARLAGKFTAADMASDHLSEMIDLLNEAAENSLGLAVMQEN